MDRSFKFFVIAVPALILLASCAVTTESTEGTSETFLNTSEVSTDFSSSTFPRGDGDSANAIKYIHFNMARLRADMAVGQGEYLSSLAVVMDINETKKPAFYHMTKAKFHQLFASPNTSAEELLGKLTLEISHMTVS